MALAKYFTRLFWCCIFLSAVIIHANAQPYQSMFGKQETQWTTLVTTYQQPAEFRIYRVDGDTMINGYKYKTLNTAYPGITGPIIRSYLREDLNTGKVWYKSSWDTGGVLLMDLGLQVGDTFYYQDEHGWPWASSTPYVVDSVYYLSARKHVRFNVPFWFGQYLEFIEGVGPNMGIGYEEGVYNVNDYKDRYLLCASKDDSDRYMNPYYKTCDVTRNYLSVSQTQSRGNSISLFPNPAAGLLQYTITGMWSTLPTYTITNILGQQCISGTLDKSATKSAIDISRLQSGIYFFQCNINGQMIQKKFSKL